MLAERDELEAAKLELHAVQEEVEAEKHVLQADRDDFIAEKLEWQLTKGGGGSAYSKVLFDLELEAAKAQLKADRFELEAEKNHFRHALFQLKKAADKLHQPEGATEKVQSSIAQSQLKAAQSQLDAALFQIDTAQTQLQKARGRLKTARKHLKAIVAQTDIDKSEVESAKASLSAVKHRFQAAGKELNASKSRLVAAKFRLDLASSGIETEQSKLEDDKAALETKVLELESLNAEILITVSQLENDQLGLVSDLEKRKTEVESLFEKTREVQKQLDRCIKDKKTTQDGEVQGLQEQIKELGKKMETDSLEVVSKLKEIKAETERLSEKMNDLVKQFIQTSKYRKAYDSAKTNVFFDLRNDFGESKGRIVIELDTKTTPRTAENFRALCTGEKGEGKSGWPLEYKGSRFILCAGQDLCCGGYRGNSMCIGESIYGGATFPAENFIKKHTGPGIVSMMGKSDNNIYRGYMQNAGLVSIQNNSDDQYCNGSMFFITTKKTELYDGKRVAFGHVVDGMDVVLEMERTRSHWVVNDCGQLS